MSRPKVVYVGHCARLSGAEIALARLLPVLAADVDALVVLAEDGPIVGRLRERGVRTLVLPLAASVRDLPRGGLFGVFGYVATLGRYVLRLRRLLHDERADLVHTNSLKASLYGGLAGRLARVPVVWHLRDRVAADYLPRPVLQLVRAAARLLPTAVVANSAATLATLPGHAGTVVPEVFSPPPAGPPDRRDDAPLTVGLVGRLTPWKGQDLFLRAFARAFGDTDARAVVVGSAMFGEDAYAAGLGPLARDLGIADRVEFRGFRDDVWAELGRLDVLVHCSVTPEPFGQVVLEGMAAGLAVLAAVVDAVGRGIVECEMARRLVCWRTSSRRVRSGGQRRPGSAGIRRRRAGRMSRTRDVVVVAFGAPDLLAAALDPLSGERVVVVDNSSRADVAAVVAAAGARYVDPGSNLGFAAGVNVGLAGLTGDVLLVNPDARITRADLDALQMTFVDHDDVGAVSPALVGPTGTPQRTHWPFPSARGMWAEAIGLSRWWRPAGGFVVGATLLLRRETLDDIGGFDDRYFLYAEEADWQRRAAGRGWRTLVVPEVTATHVGSATSTDPERREELFHAAQERYVRRWSGPLGWAGYRAAAVTGAAIRTVVRRDRAAARRIGLYRRGPVAVARPPRGRSLQVAHVVVTDGAAGTERYVVDVATRQAAAGHHVTVLGGAEGFMTASLPAGVSWLPAATPRAALRALRSLGGLDVVHAHLTAADLVAVATRPWHGARVVSTRHTATPRGTTLAARVAAKVLERGIAVEICTSEFVRAAVRRPAAVLAPGVSPDDRRPDPTSRRLLVAQRLDAEKATDVAVRAWQASGLAGEGWTLVVCGDGRDREVLQARAEREAVAGIEWTGWSPDVRGEMTRAAALLAPAPREPFGLSVVEAMAVGLPVVAAAGGGHRETVGRCAAMPSFPPGDRDACADALREVSSWTPAQHEEIGESLRTLQRSAFDLDRHVDALDRLYRDATEEARR